MNKPYTVVVYYGMTPMFWQGTFKFSINEENAEVLRFGTKEEAQEALDSSKDFPVGAQPVLWGPINS